MGVAGMCTYARAHSDEQERGGHLLLLWIYMHYPFISSPTINCYRFLSCVFPCVLWAVLKCVANYARKGFNTCHCQSPQTANGRGIFNVSSASPSC